MTTAATANETRQQAVRDYIYHKGLRMTFPRLRLIEIIGEMDGNFTASLLIEKAEASNISSPTVYAFLYLCVQAGVLNSPKMEYTFTEL